MIEPLILFVLGMKNRFASRHQSRRSAFTYVHSICEANAYLRLTLFKVRENTAQQSNYLGRSIAARQQRANLIKGQQKYEASFTFNCWQCNYQRSLGGILTESCSCVKTAWGEAVWTLVSAAVRCKPEVTVHIRQCSDGISLQSLSLPRDAK